MEIVFSIIIPVFNAGEYLGECIDSISKQSFAKYEAIFVDDGSTDNSVEIIKEKAHTLNSYRLICQQNSGVSVARNKGLDIACGTYIFFLDSDDRMTGHSLQLLYKTIENHPELDFVMGNHVTMDVFGHPQKINDYFLSRQNYANIPLESGRWMKQIVVGHGNIWGYLFKKSVIDELNLRFDDNIVIAEDVIFLMEYITGRQGMFLEECTYEYRYQIPGSLSNIVGKNEKDIASCLTFLEKAESILKANIDNVEFKEGTDILKEYMCRRCLGIICRQPHFNRIAYLKKLKMLKNKLRWPSQGIGEKIIVFIYNYFSKVLIFIPI